MENLKKKQLPADLFFLIYYLIATFSPIFRRQQPILNMQEQKASINPWKFTTFV
jgi:hypothetical protein